jgi:hypothetical protein
MSSIHLCGLAQIPLPASILKPFHYHQPTTKDTSLKETQQLYYFLNHIRLTELKTQ